ncbi:MAG: endopeptidase La [Gemmatimonadetes bacterium]|nr:endopeptidase La [Gemmatimonadota bacterium]
MTNKADLPEQLPVLPLRNTVIFPGVPTQLLVGRDGSLELMRTALEQGRVFAAVAQRDTQVEDPKPEDLYSVGIVGLVHRTFNLPDGNMQVLVRGLQRVELIDYVQRDPFLVARVTALEESGTEGQQEILALAQNLSQLFQKMVGLVSGLEDDLQVTAINLEKQPVQLSHFVASGLDLPLAEKQKLLEEDNIKKRLKALTVVLNNELSILEMGSQIQSQIQEEMGNAQREHYLREQMRVIQRELGEEGDGELDGLRRKLAKAKIPSGVREVAQRELNKLAQMPGGAAEYAVSRTYLDWIFELPWQRKSPDRIDLKRARKVLDVDHKGLDKIKERLLEYLSVRKLKKDAKGPIFCFVGPPGVGKTSLGQSIARALGRKFVRISLGGVHDESEIRGHRRTYVGALPGRIVQGLRKAGTNNPVFMLDEIDKLGADFRGDPAAALLEVLDPAQNNTFADHYLDIPFDLSKIVFIATANQLETIPPALRDRLEVIQLLGYTEDEKVEIAQSHILPRQLAEHGLVRRKVAIAEDALRVLIRGYTQEPGLRGLEREVGRICRKIALRVVGGERGPFVVGSEDLVDYVGNAKVHHEGREEISGPGLVAGLAWTPAGGEVMYVEATKMTGNGGLTLTGQLGDVMRESAQIALSYIRSHTADWGIAPDFFEVEEIHVHLPAGAIPKDGPSAGVAVATALLSLLTGRTVRADVAMTGEVTLRGRVLAVGGIKEKVLAAHRAGIDRVILPRRSERDLDDLPPQIRRKMHFALVDDLVDVFAACFAEQRVRRAA